MEDRACTAALHSGEHLESPLPQAFLACSTASPRTRLITSLGRHASPTLSPRQPEEERKEECCCCCPTATAAMVAARKLSNRRLNGCIRVRVRMCIRTHARCVLCPRSWLQAGGVRATATDRPRRPTHTALSNTPRLYVLPLSERSSPHSDAGALEAVARLPPAVRPGWLSPQTSKTQQRQVVVSTSTYMYTTGADPLPPCASRSSPASPRTRKERPPSCLLLSVLCSLFLRSPSLVESSASRLRKRPPWSDRECPLPREIHALDVGARSRRGGGKKRTFKCQTENYECGTGLFDKFRHSPGTGRVAPAINARLTKSARRACDGVASGGGAIVAEAHARGKRNSDPA